MSKHGHTLWLCSLAILILALPAMAQTSKSDPTDVQGWYGAKLNAELSKNWKIDLEAQVRFYNNLKTYNGAFFSLGGERRINDYFSLIGEYRLALVQKGVYNRLSAGGSFTYEWEKPEFEFRLLVQNQLQDFDEVGRLSQREFYARTRFRLKYPVSEHIDIYLATEPIFKYKGRQLIDNVRNLAGVRFPIAGGLKGLLYYIYRPDFAKSYTRTFHTFGAEIIYTLKKEKNYY